MPKPNREPSGRNSRNTFPESKAEVESYLSKKRETAKQETPKSAWSLLPESLQEIEERRQKQYQDLQAKKENIIPTATGNMDAERAGYNRALAEYGNYWGDKAAYDEGFAGYNAAMDRVRGQYDSHEARHAESDRKVEERIARTSGMQGAGNRMADADRRSIRDKALYNRMGKDANTAGDYELYQRAAQGYNKTVSDYATNYSQAQSDYWDAAKTEQPGYYYANTMSADEVDAKLEELRATREKLHENLMGVLSDIDNNPHTPEERQRLSDTKYRIQDRYTNINNEIDYLETAKGLHKQRRGDDMYNYWLNEGGLEKPENYAKVEQGKAKYEADQLAASGGMKEPEIATPAGGAIKAYRNRNQKENEWDNIFDNAPNLTPSDEMVFYALYADDPEQAMEWAYYINNRRNSEFQGEMAEFGYEHPGWAWLGGLGNRMISGVANFVDPNSAFAQKQSLQSTGLMSGGAQALNEWSGTIDTDIPIIKDLFNGKGAGDFYQLASSIAESGINMAVASYTGDAAKLVGALGTFIMGSSAAAADYNESLQRGLTTAQAQRHALAAGINEAAFEFISLDKVIKADKLAGQLKKVFVDAGIEASEEFCTTVANRVADGYLARQDGYDTQVEQRTKELIALGLSRAEAEAQAEKEWRVELINDAIGGFISGGFHSFIEWGGGKVANKIATNQNNEIAGVWTDADEIAALRAYADENGIKYNEKALQGMEAVETDESGRQSAVPTETRDVGTDSSPTAQNDNEETTKKKQSRKEARQERKSNRATGALQTQVEANLAKTLHESGLNNAQAFFEQTVSRYGEGITRTAQNAVANEARAIFGQASNQSELTELYQKAVEGVTAQPIKQALQKAYDEGTAYLYHKQGDEGAKNRIIQQLGNTGKQFNTTVVLQNEDGTERSAKITDVLPGAERVKLDNGETVAVRDLAGIDADTKDILDMIGRLEIGSAADILWKSFKVEAGSRTGSENSRYILDWTQAFDQGRTNTITMEEAVRRSSLDKATVEQAYKLGQQERATMDKAKEERLAKAREQAKKGFTGKKGIVDDTGVSKHALERAMQNDSTLKEQIKMAEVIAEALGVDIKLFNSFDKKTWHGTENGSYNAANNTIMLDINAGKTAANDFTSGLLAVCGHELTHWMETFAFEAYGKYKDAVVQYIVQAYGKDGLNKLIHEQQERNQNLSRDEAIDEIVADASMDRMGDKAFWQAVAENLGEDRTEVRGKIAQFFDKYLGKIKEALRTKQVFMARVNVARLEKQMQDALSALYAEGIREAAKNRKALTETETAYKSGDYKKSEIAQGTASVNPSDTKKSSRPITDSTGRELSEGQQAYFEDSRARDINGNLLVLYHQTENEFTVFDPRHEGAGTRDQQTPFGIFLKSSDRDIGVKGKKQMALYANITKPLVALNRENLESKLRDMFPEYAKLSDQHKALDQEYKQKHEQAKQAFTDYLAAWRKQHPNAGRSEIYQDADFDRLWNAEDDVIEEWEQKARKLETETKEVLTNALEAAGYDGIFLGSDTGSWGRSTDAYIALHPEQVKNVNNLNPTENPDIRYSTRAFDSVKEIDKEISRLSEEYNRIFNDNRIAREKAKKDPRVVKLQEAAWKAEDEKGRVGSLKERVAYRKMLDEVMEEMKATSVDDSLSEIRKQIDELKAEREAMVSVTPITGKQYKKLIDYFGTTQDYDTAGFILQDGQMLDFSGKKQYGKNYAGGREIYHNEVGEVLNLETDTSPRINMINNGNIRLAPEVNGINLTQKPTAKQREALRGYIDHNDGNVQVDIDNTAGRTIETLHFYPGTSATRVLNDIDAYFDTGKTPAPQSDLRAFYSTRSDTAYLEAVERGDLETAQKMVDEAAKEAGYIEIGYHGTYSRFNAFDPTKSNKRNDLGPGIYLTTDEANARGYAGTNGIWNVDLQNNVDAYAQGYADDRYDMEEDYEKWVEAYNTAWDERAKEIEENGHVLSLYAHLRNPFTVSNDAHITTDEAIRILKAMPKSAQENIQDWIQEVRRMAGNRGTITTYDFANSNWSPYLSSALSKLGYDGIKDSTVNKKYSLAKGTEHYVVFNATDVKSTDPVTYDDSGNVIPLSERFNPENEDIRYSERDYDTTSDFDLLLNAADEIVDGGGDEYWASLLESDPGIAGEAEEIKRLGKQLKKTEADLAEARRNLTLTDRKLKTRGIASLAATIMQDQKAGDVNHNDVQKRITAVLTEAYQKALDQLDAGADVSDAWETVYQEGVVKAADILLTDATHSEKISYKWYTKTLGEYLGEGAREYVEAEVAARVAQDFDANRYRPGQKATVADRLVAQAENRANKKLDAAKTENAALKAENAKLTETKDFYKEQAETAKATAGELYQQLLDKREELKNNKKISADERKATLKKLDNMTRQMQAKRREAEVWKSKSEIGWKAANKAVQEKQAAVDKLEKQLQREQDILSGKLKPPAIQKMLKAAREREAERVAQQKDERFAKYKEGKKASDLRKRIKNLSDDMKRTMVKPTDGSYVPASLYGSMTKLADALDELLAPNEGTKAAGRYRAVMDQIHALSSEYQAVANLDDPVYSSEYDEEIQHEINELVRTLQGANADEVGTLNMNPAKARELTVDELQKVYDIMKYINYCMKNAKSMMASGTFHSVYDAMEQIAEQQQSMKSLNRLGWYSKSKRLRMLDSLNVMRATEMMSDWDRSAALYQLMQQIENGVDVSNAWMMEYNKALQALKTGKNEKAYRDALTKKLDFNVTDEEGLPVLMTKMQALQLLMTAEREAHNDKLVHLQKGGATIRDALAIQDGKKNVKSQNIKVTPELIQRIQDSLSEWDKAYMKAIRDYFKREGKATNNVMYKLKHRVLQTEDYYVPYVVDKNYLDTNLDEKQAMSMWVKTPGSTNTLQKKASQPVIIDGMDTVMAKHVREIADYVGLALPIRDFSKVYNGRLKQGEDENPLPVKQTIGKNFGEKGQHLLTQSIIDVQGGGRGTSWSTAIAEHLNALQSAFVKSALLVNPSVTIKQAASYVAAGSILSHTALDRANHPISVKTDESHSFDPATGLIGHIFFAPNGATATRIYNEIDKHTSLHYQRRLGMSQAELANEANRSGKVRRAMNSVGASMEQNVFGHAARKVGASLNPVSWIQRMDVATTATLWLACKEQARMDGMKVGTEEYWNHVTELYERVIRETQPMYDSMHRNAGQKSRENSLMQYLFPFRTVPIQNHGQIAASYETLQAALKSKDEARIKQAKKFFAKTMWAQTESAIIFSLMTFIAAALKRKTKKYRDEDEEISLASILEGIGRDTAGTMVSNFFPLFGSTIWDELGNIYDAARTGKKVWSYDTFSVGTVDMMNDFAKASWAMISDAFNWIAGNDVTWDKFSKDAENLVVKSLKCIGFPSSTIKTYVEGFVGNLKDVPYLFSEGRIPALNDASWERSAAVNANRYLKAWIADDDAKLETVKAEMMGNYAAAGKNKEEANKALKTKLTATAKDAFVAGTLDMTDAILFLVDTGYYDEDKAWLKVKEWKAENEHADDDDYSWSKYEDLYAAMDSDADIEPYRDELESHGVKADTIKNAVVDHVKERYEAGEIDAHEAMRLLQKYKGMSENDAYWKVDAWDAKEEEEANGEKTTNSNYRDLYAAIDANADASAAIQELTEHGYKERDVYSAAKDHLVERFEKGEINETQFKNQLSRYAKIVKQEDVDPIVNNAKCYKETGYRLGSLNESYLDGEITAEKYKQIRVKYGGKTAEEAKKQVRWLDLKKAHPDLDITESVSNNWYDGTTKTRENGHESAKAAGMSIEAYLKAKATLDEIKDSNDNGTGEDEVIAAIAKMNLTARQKDALYYERYKGGARKGIYKTW